MTLRNARPLRFSPAGLSDTIAEEDAFPGACSILQNLIPDSSTKNVWTPRPASLLQTTFPGDDLPTGVTVFKVVGDHVFGMLSSSTNVGYDEPFCYNLTTKAFVTVSGVTSSNVPLTQPTTGDWTPPTIDVMGIYAVVTHPGFDGVTNFIGWFDISDLTAPTWTAGNFVLAGQPTSVSIANAGTTYTDGVYTNVAMVYGGIYPSGAPLPPGNGVGLTCDITVAGGLITVCTINTPGLGYAVNDALTSDPSAGPGAGDGEFLIQIASASASKGITAVRINNPGSGYTSTTYTNAYLSYAVSPTGSITGSGVGAVATIVVAGGVVTSVLITTPGGGYSIGDLLTYTGMGSGTGFTVRVVAIQPTGGFIAFTTIPSFVRQFNGRSWFGINPANGQPSLIFSDVYALNCTNANQVLEFGDDSTLNAAAPLPLSNLLGGVIQALIVFKTFNGIVQITGDYTTNNLLVSDVPGGSGTGSPRSVTPHPQGLLYLDHDGFRMVTLDGTCSDPIAVSGSGVAVPFINPVYPTRVNAACNGSVLRASVQAFGQPWVEYWYDLVRKIWSGPHTFPSSMIDVWDEAFVLVPQAMPASIFLSAAQPSDTDSLHRERRADAVGFSNVRCSWTISRWPSLRLPKCR